MPAAGAGNTGKQKDRHPRFSSNLKRPCRDLAPSYCPPFKHADRAHPLRTQGEGFPLQVEGLARELEALALEEERLAREW